MSDPPRDEVRRHGLQLLPPVAVPFFALLGLLLVVAMALVELEAVETAYERIGIGSRHVFALLLLSLAGSWVNVPVAVLRAELESFERDVRIFGVRYVIPAVEERGRTVVAVNVGGALIPIGLSVYFLAVSKLWGVGLLATLVMAAIIHTMARPIPKLGIAMPAFLPAPIAAGLALLMEFLRRTIKTPKDITDVLNLPVLGMIPKSQT